MFWSSVPKGPWAGPSPRGSKSRVGVGGSNARGANARRRQLAPEPYSLGHLRVLFQRLIDAQEGRVEGETIVVETLRAISEVVVYGENQDAKLAARAAAKEAQERHEKDAAAATAAAAPAASDLRNAKAQHSNSSGHSTRPPAKAAEGGGDGGDDGPPPDLKGLTTDVRREDAFFELFCEKNMMSRFLDLLRSPSSRYLEHRRNGGGGGGGGNGNGKKSGSGSSAQSWGDNGGIDAVVRAITWGGDVLTGGQPRKPASRAGGAGGGGGGGGGGGRGSQGGRRGSAAGARGSAGSGVSGGTPKRSAGTGGRDVGEGGGGREGERSSAELQVQVIQTTSILVMNVKSDTSLFYLLSNNHVNDMILFDFRLEDEEVLSHFASFLKTLSLRLNENTVQFFLRGPRRRSESLPLPSSPAASNTGGPTTGAGPAETADAGQERGEAAASGGGVENGEASSSPGQQADRPKGTGAEDEVHGPSEKGKQPEEGHREEQEEVDGGASFPLYTRALEYICHGDFHVRIAALTVVLNIYNQRDPLVRAYLNGPAARSASLPDRLVGALRSQCLVLADRAMAAGVGGGGGGGGQAGGGSGGAGAGGAAAIDPTICRDSIAGLQDQVFYLEDVFASGQRELNAQLCESLLSRLVRPMLLGDWLSGRSGAMFPQVALCALAQLFIVVTHPPLVRLLVLETLGSCSEAESGAGSSAPLLALLQGDREELCLGALVVLQALAQNRVVRTDLGLAQASAGEDFANGFPAHDHEGLTDATNAAANPSGGGGGDDDDPSNQAQGAAAEAAEAEAVPSAATKAEQESMRPLGMEILDAAVDALCCMLAPSAAAQTTETEARTTAIAAQSADRRAPAGSGAGTPGVSGTRGSKTAGSTFEKGQDVPKKAGAEGGGVPGSLGGQGQGEEASGGAEGSDGGTGGGQRRRDTVLRRIGDAHAAAAAAVLRGMGEAEAVSIVAFEEEIREWSKRVGLDGAITNLPKMSSLILRWSLDNTSPPQPPRRAPPSPSVTSDGDSGGGADAKDGGGSCGRARQRELRSSLQAFLEVRQVWRLLSGRGEADPAVLSIAGLGPQAEEDQPREDGSLDLGGRKCLACSISDPPDGGPSSRSGGGGGEGGDRKRRSGVAAAIAAASAAAGRRGRSETYLVLDAKAFLLAVPDRHKLSNGEIRSSAPLLHLAAVADPDDEKRLHIRALSHRPVALMRPVMAPRLSSPISSAGGGGKGGRGAAGGAEAVAAAEEEDGAGGDAGSMCDMQAWACELSFENEKSCREARKHMEGRRLRLRSEKTKCITDLLEACVEGRDD
eukprot:g11683.t1